MGRYEDGMEHGLGLCGNQVYRGCDARPWETLVAAEKRLGQLTPRWTVGFYRAQGRKPAA